MSSPLPGGWTFIRSRPIEGGTVVLAERMHPVDFGPRKRNMIDQYTAFRVGSDGPVAGANRWDRASAEEDFASL